MTNKRPLTAEEKTIAKRMKSIIASDPHLTEESVGASIGVSQGQISHWTGGRLPVPATRAAALAKALGIKDASEISLAYRKISASAQVREQGSSYGNDSNRELEALQTEIDALKTTVAIMLTVGSSHRPIEGAELARSLRKHAPGKLLAQGFVCEILQTLDKRSRSKASLNQPQAESTGR